MKYIVLIASVVITGLIILTSCVGDQKSNSQINEDKFIVNNAPSVEINYLEIGKELAMKTKSGLAGQLTKAIGEKGTEGAVEFCNIKAISITDSMSLALDSKIKRVSDLPRNPKNQANETELAYIQKWKDASAKGEQQAPIVTEIGAKMVGYYPIITNQMCMQCHGKPDKDINPATHNKIKKLYPKDQAIGYVENEIRGIFVVEMNKK